MYRANTLKGDCTVRSNGVALPAWRTFWACVLLVHLLAIRSTVSSVQAFDSGIFAAIITRCLGLSLGAVFCGLKLLDVPLLRLKPGWRSTVTAGVAIALLHIGALDHGSTSQSAVSPSHVGVVLFIGAMIDIRAIAATVRNRLAALKRYVQSEQSHVHLNPYLRAVEASFEPTHSSFEPCLVAPRAPPLFS